ncbi:MAG: hypothetical protein R3F59_34615 [Myxococcota bacterium]
MQRSARERRFIAKEAVMDEDVPLTSRRHPVRLDVRAGMMLASAPLLIAFGAYQSLLGTGEAASRGPLALVAGVLFLAVGAWWWLRGRD